MRIGSLKTFGKQNKAGVRFGFLRRLGEIGEIYFNEKQIERSSKFLEQCCAGDYVVYEERQFDSGSSAFRVRMLKELDEKALRQLYEECRDEVRAAELELLIKTAPKLLDQESPENIVSLAAQLRAKGVSITFILLKKPELFLTSPELCACLQWGDVWALPLGLVQTEEQMEFLARYVTDGGAWGGIVEKLPAHLVLRCPRVMDSATPQRAISILSRIDWTSISEDDLERCRPLLRRIDHYCLSGSGEAAVVPLLERESFENIVSLVTQTKANGKLVVSILRWKPELLWTSPEVCACVRWQDFGGLPLEQLIQTDEQAAFLARWMTDESTWSAVVRELPDRLVLHCQRARDTIPGNRAISILSGIDWSNISEDALERYRPLLFRLNHYNLTDAEMAVVLPLLERESFENIVSLVTRTRAKGKAVVSLLKWKPELLWTRQEVCACVRGEDVKGLPLDRLIQTDEQAAFLARWITDEDAWKTVMGKLSDRLVLHCRRALDTVSSDRALSILSGIDWTNISEDDLERCRSLLVRIHFDYEEIGAAASLPFEDDYIKPGDLSAAIPLLGRESTEDLISLVKQLLEKGRPVAFLLQWKPELLRFSPEIRARVRWSDIKNLPPESIFQCPQAMDTMMDGQASALFSRANWRDTSEGNLEQWRPLLMKLHWDGFPKSITAAAASLQEQGMALELCWWKLFTNSMKVRLLIYLTNFKEKREEQDWFHALQKVQRWEREAGNGLTCAVLQYFAGMYAKTEKQYTDNFLKAHDMLMNYITDSFTKEVDVTPGLSSLLEHCRDTTSDVRFFCDGRVWEKANRIYCPIVGYSCRYYPDTDLTKTRFRGSRGAGAELYTLQAFMDFLLNIGGIPDLTDLKIGKRYEYPFRVSAYVNSLLQLRPHMKCSHCGELFHPRFEYAKQVTAKLGATVFYCSRSDQDGSHDHNVYLNFCYHCHEIIDSRECKVKVRVSKKNAHGGSGEEHWQYLCMHCGGAQGTDPGTKCPQCGCSDPAMLTSPSNRKIACKNCGYDSRKFRSKFEEMLNS